VPGRHRPCLPCGVASFAALASALLAAHASDIVIRPAQAVSNGLIVVQLYDSAEAFERLRDPLRKESFPAGQDVSYVLKDVPPGTYALLVYHDADGDGKLGRNFIGIPREPVGFSNGYRPKGPPRYDRARFELTEGQEASFDVALERPLGRRGRIGAGVGVVVRTSPYRGSRESAVRIIPAVTYIGPRFQLFGPFLQVGLVHQDRLSLALTARYRIGSYEAEDSAFFAGLADREDTMMAGLALKCDLPAGIDLSAQYEEDVLGLIGGGEARLAAHRSFRFRPFSLSPEIGINAAASKIANHDYGVPAGNTTSDRPAYELDNAMSWDVGLGTFFDLPWDWRVMVSAGVEFLGEEIVDSPLVDRNHLLKGFALVNRVF